MGFTVKATGTSADGAPDTDQVRRALSLLADHDAGIELRALPYGKGITGKWDDPKLLQFVADHNDAKGIYYTLNPVPVDLIPAVAATGSKVGNIIRRRWLLIDIDPERPPDTNASEAEHQAAAERANKILGVMVGAGWPVPVLVDSGNGYHLLWRIDLPNDEESRQLIKATLVAAAGSFDDAVVKIDVKVFNSNRISKLPGTWARKGPHSAERPHRLCRIVSSSEDPTLLTAEQIRAVLPKETNPAVPPAVRPEDALRGAMNGQAGGDGASSPFKLRAGGDPGSAAYAKKALDLEAAKVALAMPGSRNDALNKAAFALGQLVAGGMLGRADVESRLTLAAERAGLPQHEAATTIRSGLDAGAKDPRTAPERGNGPVKSGPEAATIHERKRPTIYSATDVMEMEIPPPRWAIPGLLSEGLSLLAGKPKLGKSWLALNLALTIAAGGTALGMTKVVPGDVLYLALEDRLRRIQDRTRKLLAGLGLAVSARLSFATAWPRSDDGGLDYIEEWAAGVERPTMVVVDVWAKFRPVYKSQGNQYDQDYQHGAAIKDLADKYGMAALALHHTKKAAVEDVVDEISGTLGIAGSADGALILKRSRGETDGTISITGRDVDERDIAVSFDPVTCAWKSLGSAAAHTTSKVRIAVIAALRGALLTASEVADAADLDKDTVRKEMHRMTADRILEKRGPRYRLERDEDADESPAALF